MNRFSPLQISNRVTRNRVVVPPMASQTADEFGRATSQTIDHYQNLAKSGAGIVFVEYTYVDRSGRSEDRQLGIDSDEKIPRLRQVADSIKVKNALAGIQLTHAGGKTERSKTDGSLLSPSGVPVPVYNRKMPTPDKMNLDDIAKWRRQFVDAAARAYRAGFDIVEIHAAHGYGFNQWISPITNTRTDLYGGTLQNRTRLLFETIRMIRERWNHLLIAIRLPGQDLIENGLSVEQVEKVSSQLEGLGVDIIDVSSGLGGWKRPRNRTGQGYLISEAKRIKKVVNIPVIGVGGIQQGSFIDQLVAQEVVDLTAVGRAILQNPKSWNCRQMQKCSLK